MRANPPRHLAVESLRLYATRRMLWTVLVLAFAVLIPLGGTALLRPGRPPLPSAVPEVPPLDWTTDGGPMATRQVLAGFPGPGPNQKRAGHCDPERAQVEINGGCWVETKTPPPCPMGKQWEHEGRCWLPVAEAKPIPTTGEPLPVNVAGEP